MNSYNNLKPFTGANDPRRQNGRKKGSKNLSTIVNELLDTDMSLTEPISDEMKQYFSNSPTTYAKAVATAMMISVIQSPLTNDGIQQMARGWLADGSMLFPTGRQEPRRLEYMRI